MIIDRMLSRLSHINPAIIVSATKVMLKFSKSLESPKLVEGLCRKIAGSLIAVMGRSPEIVWVFLRNVEIMLARFPGVVSNPKAFFVNFNDPGYVKMQKVQVLGLLCDETTTKTIVNELSEYSYDTNVEFSRFSFQHLWKIGSKFESALEPVTKAIANILFNAQDVGFIDHLLNEAALAVEAMFRRYRNPKVLVEIFSFVVKAHERINKPESLCGLLNTLPDFPQFEVDAFKIIQKKVDNFLELGSEVQMACLSASIRMFTVDPEKYGELVPQLLDTIDKNIENPDIRDRAFIYWRLLDLNPELARSVVMGTRDPVEHTDDSSANKALFEELFDRIGGIAATLQDRHFTQISAGKQAASMANTDEATPKAKQNREDDILQLEPDDLISIDPIKDLGKVPTALIKRNEPPKTVAGSKESVLDLQFDTFAVPNQTTATSSNAFVVPPIQAVGQQTANKGFDHFMNDFNFNIPPPTVPLPTLAAPTSTEVEQARQSYDENMDKYSSFNLLHLQTPPPGSSSTGVKPTEVTAPKIQPGDAGAFEFEFGDFLAAPSLPHSTLKAPPKIEYANRKSSEVVSFSTKGKRGRDGIQIQGTLRRENQLLFVSLVIENHSNTPLTDMIFDLKPNNFGLIIRQTEVEGEIHAGGFLKVDLPLGFDASAKTDAWTIGGNTRFTVEFTCNYDTWQFNVDCWLHNLFVT
jgi:hypothetical protein